MIEVGHVLPPMPGVSDARRRLYTTAIELFGARSYDAVSVRDVASALGVAPGALYAHVPSKQQLLFELVLLGHEVHRDSLKAALLDAGAEPDSQIRALTRAHVQVHLQYSALARVTNREIRALDPGQLAAVLLLRSESERMFLDVVQRGIRLGAFESDQPRLAVSGIAAMGVRAAEWWTPLDPSPAEIADTYADYALRLLRKN